jgi:glucose-6-phosphate 1-dehydrogenase
MAETIGVETRGHYYESSGAIRDMVQNHLLQLLALVAMEPPISLEAEAIRNEKVKALRSIRLIRGNEVAENLVRGQYEAGIAGGKAVRGYRQEPDVAAESNVETFAALKVFLDTWRWSGVPFFIRTGKRLSRRHTEIAIQFKAPPLNLFGGWNSVPRPNVLSWRIQPDEGVRFLFNSKTPGFSPALSPVQMSFAYGSSFGEAGPDAYERLLLDVLHDDSTLFTRNDEIEAAWNFTTHLLDAVAERSQELLVGYRAGSSGPAEADRLLTPFQTTWRRL